MEPLFNIGDTVRRVQRGHLGMRVGDVGTVVSYVPAGTGRRAHKITDGVVLAEWPGRAGPGTHSVASLERVAPAIDQHAPGAKLDDGKLKPDLILEDMARALTEVIKVATFGANKYTEGGWLQVPNGQVRYRRAQMRHALARATGEECDSESNLPHLAHEAWNALARLELALREKAGK